MQSWLSEKYARVKMKKGLYDDDDFSFTSNCWLDMAEAQSAATQAMAS